MFAGDGGQTGPQFLHANDSFGTVP